VKLMMSLKRTFAILIGASAAGAAFAGQLTVCPQGCEFSSIQSAVDAAHGGDVIEIGRGTYFENVKISKALTLNGAGRDKTRIDGRLLGPVFTLSSPPDATTENTVRLTNMTITHGRGVNVGGGIEVFGAARLDLSFCIVISNRSDGIDTNGAGGGISLESAESVTNKIANTIIVYNHSQSGGGGVSVSFETQAEITDSTISRNDTQGLGGGIDLLAKSIAKITGTSLTENSAKLGGGGVFADRNRPFQPGAEVTITDSVIADNLTTADGGGLEGQFTISDSIVARNTAAHDGGGLFSEGFALLSRVFVVQNAAGRSGGGIFTSTGLLINDTTIAQNKPDNCVEEPGIGSGCP
jgi:hypothetical protein